MKESERGETVLEGAKLVLKGGMACDVDITILLLNCEYIFAVQNNFMLLQAFLK